MSEHLTQTLTASGDLDFDPETMTVRSDDGSRLSVWDLDDCPLCGGTIHRSYADHPGGCDILFCLNAVGLERTTCALIVERNAAMTVLPSVLATGEGG